MRFEGEEVKAVAIGDGWVAAVTSLNFLRIFTRGGLQVILSEKIIYFVKISCLKLHMQNK